MDNLKRLTALERIIQSGDNKFVFDEIKEQRKFDLNWIETLEKLLPHVERAAQNTRESIKVEQEVVAIEKVKKVDSSTVRHLAANSNLVREITSQGDVVPTKLLTSFKIEDYGVYENRFLKTLIIRLYRYINNRKQAVQKNYASHIRRELKMDSKFKHQGRKFTVSLGLEGVEDVLLEAGGQSYQQIMARIERLFIMIKGLRYSRFMRLMEQEKEIRPPIMKTNVIMKNVDFIAAYNLWVFIDRETTLKFDLEHRARKLGISNIFQQDLYQIIGTIYRKYVYYTSNQRINYDAKEKLTKKKPNIVQGYSGKFVIPDDEIQIENPQFFEYYLQQITGKIHKNYKDFIVSGRSKREAAERVLRDLVAVADTIFDTINIAEQPPSQDLKLQLKHLEDEERVVASYVTVKEVNLRKYQRKLESLQRQKTIVSITIAKKELQERKKIEREKLKEKARIEKEKAALLAKQKVLKEKERKAELARKAREKKIADRKAKEAELLAKQKKAEERKIALEKARLEKARKLAVEKELRQQQRLEEKERLRQEKALLLLKKEEEKRAEKLQLLAVKERELAKEKAKKEREKKKQKVQKELEKKKQHNIKAKLNNDSKQKSKIAKDCESNLDLANQNKIRKKSEKQTFAAKEKVKNSQNKRPKRKPIDL